jgi:DNA phosphorothioation-associated putative methyltransferase
LLQNLGVEAQGWDPHFAPDAPKQQADVVNLGYVLNVIEDLNERRIALQEAAQLAGKLLVVSVLIGQSNHRYRNNRYKDGVITTRGTFQKYFSIDEIVDFIQQTLGIQPIFAGPGIYYVFNDEAAQQLYLASRLSRRSAPRRTRIKSIEELDGNARLQANRYWERCIDLGRPPVVEELAECAELVRAVPATTKLFDLIARDRDTSAFSDAEKKRKGEMLVHFALAEFGQRMYFKSKMRLRGIFVITSAVSAS